MYCSKQAKLKVCPCRYSVCSDRMANHRFVSTCDRVFAISNVPVLSMFAAIIGTPLYDLLEFLNVISLFKSTCVEESS